MLGGGVEKGTGGDNRRTSNGLGVGASTHTLALSHRYMGAGHVLVPELSHIIL